MTSPRPAPCISLVLSHEDLNIKQKTGKVSWSNFSSVSGVIYAILLVTICIILALGEALQEKWQHTYYDGIFVTYIYSVACIFIICLEFWLMPAGKSCPHRPDTSIEEPIELTTRSSSHSAPPPYSMAMEPSHGDAISRMDSSKSMGLQMVSSNTVTNPYVQAHSNLVSMSKLVSDSTAQLYTAGARSMFTSPTLAHHKRATYAVDDDRETAPTSTRPVCNVSTNSVDNNDGYVINLESVRRLFSRTGSSFYLRFGLLIFSVGNIIYLLLEFQNYVNRQQRNCDSGSFGWVTMLRICFTILQTYVLFKYPKMNVKRHKPLAYLGFAHLLATNLCIWILTVINELIFEFHHYADAGHGSSHGSSRGSSFQSPLHKSAHSESYGSSHEKSHSALHVSDDSIHSVHQRSHGEDYGAKALQSAVGHSESTLDILLAQYTTAQAQYTSTQSWQSWTAAEDVDTTAFSNLSVDEYSGITASMNMTALCMLERSFLDTAAKYLFPFVLEYSLLALGEVVLVFGQLKSSRRLSFIHRLKYLISHQALTAPNTTLVSNGEHGQGQSGGHLHHKGSFDLRQSHKGMLLGVMMIVAAVVIGILFLFHEAIDIHQSLIFYLATDVTFNCLMLLGCIVALFRLRLLSLAEVPITIDDILLLTSLALLLLLQMAVLLSDALTLSSDTRHDHVTVALSLSGALLCFVQCIVQCVVIMVGLRCYTSREQLIIRRGKEHIDLPGREAITFLLIGNIAMWAFGILLPVRYQLVNTQEEIYGALAWILIHTVAMPLLLFFRFHSSVCLADVWHAAYRPFEEKLEYDRMMSADVIEETDENRSADTPVAVRSGGAKRRMTIVL